MGLVVVTMAVYRRMARAGKDKDAKPMTVIIHDMDAHNAVPHSPPDDCDRVQPIDDTAEWY